MPSANADRLSNGRGPSADQALASRERLLVRQQAVVLRAVSIFAGADSLQLAWIAIVDELQRRFDCERVLAGICGPQGVRVDAISQQSRADRRAAETPLIEAAMAEAVLRERIVLFDGSGSDDVLPAHRALHGGRSGLRLMSIPLFHRREAVGVLMLERVSELRWAERTTVLLQCLVDLLTPLIVLRQEAEHPLGRRLVRRSKRSLAASLDRHGPRTRVAVVAALAFILSSGLIPANHDVVADATVTPIERRLVTAPFSGYVSDVSVSAGDEVGKDQSLLQLDRRDLILQRSQWQTDLDGATAELRLAMAQRDRPEMAVLRARRGRAAAEVERIEAQLGRADIVAPVAGIVVSGATHELVGRAVERGEILLEMASAEGYEVDLLVDETDMPYIEPGQRGHLSLTAVPDERHDFTVSDIHPIATAADGRTRFRVGATLDAAPDRLLPGQTGIGRVQAGRASLLWVHTRRFRAWSQQLLWEWFG